MDHDQTSERIDLDEPGAAQRWARRLGVDDQQLRSAVKAMGDDPDEVARFLGQRPDPVSDQLAPPTPRDQLDPKRVDHLGGTPSAGGSGPAGGGEN